MRIVQIGDVAGVAPALAEALGPRVDMTMMRMEKPGERWPQWLKPLALPARYLVASRVASTVRNASPPFDVAHYHWGSNGLAATIAGGRKRQPPWILHLHGSDVRAPTQMTRRCIAAAPIVICSTPDLLPLVGRAAVHLPNPVPFRERGGDRFNVGIASRPAAVKGTAIAEDAVRADWRAPLPRREFLEHLASTQVVVGQLVIGTLGLVELEAMSLGRPVVCYVDPRWYPEPPPVLIARTADEVRAHVDRLLANPGEARAIGNRSQWWVRRHHDPSRIADQLMAIYEDVA